MKGQLSSRVDGLISQSRFISMRSVHRKIYRAWLFLHAYMHTIFVANTYYTLDFNNRLDLKAVSRNNNRNIQSVVFLVLD